MTNIECYHINYRANLKRWSELVAKKKQETQNQNKSEPDEGVKEEKQEQEEEKANESKSEDDDNNESLHDVSAEPDVVKKRTVVEQIKTEALTDISFSSDDE